MGFDSEKKTFLSKSDKSKKGCIDGKIKKVVDIINNKPNHYTTSSCSGRIVLLEKAASGRKDESRWLFVSHGKAKLGDIKKQAKKLPKGAVWFMQEGAIIHVACRTIEDAIKLLNCARSASFKHAGICSLSRKTMVEIIDSERIETLFSKNGRCIADELYLRAIIAEANKKMERTWKKIRAFEKVLMAI